MFATAVAFFFSFVTHKYYPDREKDSEISKLYYLYMTLSYVPLFFKNCIIISYCPVYYIILNSIACVLLLFTGFYCSMNGKLVKNSDSDNKKCLVIENEHKQFVVPVVDILYIATQIICVIFINISAVAFYVEDYNLGRCIYMISVICGYTMVYVISGLEILGFIKRDQHHENLAQRFFHYCIYVKLFGLQLC